MKRWSIGLIGSLSATLACATVPPEPAAAASPKQLVPAAPNAAPLARPGMFAAGSAPFVRRLTPEQRDEWRFLKEAAAAGRFEHDAARLALVKSSDPGVRSLAATLVNHHASSLSALQRMLHARNMAPPMLSNEQRRALNRLSKANGIKFDREWMEAVGLHSQQETVATFEKASGTARDPQLRAWIERSLPTLRYQLAAAERIVGTGAKFTKLAPPAAAAPQAVIKSPHLATRAMGAAAASFANPADLGEGNMLLGPPRPVAVKLTEPNTR